MIFEKKILLVDDHDRFRKTLRAFLERQNLNLQIFEADSEKVAVQKALREQPDLVLLELQLPKMNGIKISKLIKDVAPDSKIIIVSMFDTEHVQEKFLGKDIDGFIGKSDFDSKFSLILRKYLRKKTMWEPKTPKRDSSNSMKNLTRNCS